MFTLTEKIPQVFFYLSDPSESRSDVYTLASQFSNTRFSGIEEISGTEMVKEHSGIWIAYIPVATEFCCKVIHLIKINQAVYSEVIDTLERKWTCVIQNHLSPHFVPV